MDFDKLSIIFTKIGLPTGIVLWGLWKLPGYVDSINAHFAAIESQQTTMIELLRQIVEIHK